VDALYGWEDTGNWSDPSAAAHPTLPDQPAPLDTLHLSGDTWWSGSRFLGQRDTTNFPPGITVYNQCGEYYQVSHSHALNEVTNYGAAMGGMLTLWRIECDDNAVVALTKALHFLSQVDASRISLVELAMQDRLEMMLRQIDHEGILRLLFEQGRLHRGPLGAGGAFDIADLDDVVRPRRLHAEVRGGMKYPG